jgi:hypothetical protein
MLQYRLSTTINVHLQVKIHTLHNLELLMTDSYHTSTTVSTALLHKHQVGLLKTSTAKSTSQAVPACLCNSQPSGTIQLPVRPEQDLLLQQAANHQIHENNAQTFLQRMPTKHPCNCLAQHYLKNSLVY